MKATIDRDFLIGELLEDYILAKNLCPSFPPTMVMFQALEQMDDDQLVEAHELMKHCQSQRK